MFTLSRKPPEWRLTSTLEIAGEALACNLQRGITSDLDNLITNSWPLSIMGWMGVLRWVSGDSRTRVRAHHPGRCWQAAAKGLR